VGPGQNKQSSGKKREINKKLNEEGRGTTGKGRGSPRQDAEAAGSGH